MSLSPFIKDAVEDLSLAFQEFKNAQEERLVALEKNGTDPLLDNKIERLNTLMDTLQDRCQKIEMANRRPMLSQEASPHLSPNTMDSQHKHAFLEYMRKGHHQALALFERKAWDQELHGETFLPSLLATDLFQELQHLSVLRPLASVVSISRHQYEILQEQEDTQVFWHSPDTMEKYGDKKTVSPKIQKLVFPVHTLFSRQHIAQSLLDDSSMDLGQWMVDLMAKHMAQAENKAFFMGKSDHSPKGILGGIYAFSEDSAPDKLHILKTGVDGDFSEENPQDNLIHLMYSLKPQYLKNAVWIMSRSALSAVRSMKTDSGHFLWQPCGGDHQGRSTLLGYPVVICDDMPDLREGEKNVPILFGNFQEGYQIIDRAGISVQRDPFSAKPYVELYITARVGGGIKDIQAIKGLLTSS